MDVEGDSAKQTKPPQRGDCWLTWHLFGFSLVTWGPSRYLFTSHSPNDKWFQINWNPNQLTVWPSGGGGKRASWSSGDYLFILTTRRYDNFRNCCSCLFFSFKVFKHFASSFFRRGAPNVMDTHRPMLFQIFNQLIVKLVFFIFL